MKKTILIIMGILLVTLVTAIPLGTIITQSQLDAQDIKLSTLEPSWITTNDRLKISNCDENITYCEATVLINRTLEKVDGGYEVISKEIPIKFNVDKYIELNKTYNKSVAFYVLERDLTIKAKFEVRKEVKKLKDWQTKENDLNSIVSVSKPKLIE